MSTEQTAVAVQEPTAITDAISNVPDTAPFSMDELRATELPDQIDQLDTDDLVLSEEMQVRRFAPPAKDIIELAQDIVRSGQTYPIIYRKIDGKNVVVDGANRVRAIEYANENKIWKDMGVELGGGRKKLKVKAMVMDLTNVEAFLKGVGANMRRFPMSPIDYSRVCSVLINDHGLTASDTAKALGKSPGWVSQIMQMGKFRAGIQKLIHTGQIGFTTAREMVEMSPEEQDEFVAEFVKTEGKGKRSKGKSREAARAKKRANAQGRGEGDVRITLTMREWRGMVEELAGVGKTAQKAKEANEEYECPYSERVQETAKLILKAMDGKIGERALANKIDATA